MNAQTQGTALAAAPIARSASLLMDPNAFAHMQRVGAMLALSPLFPEHLRKGPSKEVAIANGVLVMNMAARLNEDPLTVAQNIYFVGGKPGWSASYMISKANQHGVFKDPIDWEIKGAKDTLSVTAWGVLTGTGKRVQVTCDMAMAKAEGWTKNAKYQSMPEQMLRYRSATFLIRLYCPEVMVGVPAAIEHEAPMRDVTPQEAADMNFERGLYNATNTAAEAAESASEAVATAADAAASASEAVSTAEDSAASAKDAQGAATAADEPSVVGIEQFQALYERIASDLLDGIVPEKAIEPFAAEIGAMKAHAPGVFALLCQELDSYAPGLANSL